MEFNTILLIVAIVLLAASLLVKGYGMMQLANKDLPQEERMARYKKTMPLTYPHARASRHHCALSCAE